MGQNPPLRLGIICSGMGTVFPRWQAECLRRLLVLPMVELALIIADTPDSPTRLPTRPATRTDVARQCGGQPWRLYASHYLTKRIHAITPIDLGEELTDIPIIHRNLTQPGGLDARDADGLDDDNLDAVLCLLPDAPPGNALRAPRHGVWVFRHGALGPRRDCPPCFWEVYRDEAVVVATLERVGARDGGAVLREGVFKTVGYSYARTCDGVLAGCVDWPAQVCLAITTTGAVAYDHTSCGTQAIPCQRAPRGRHGARLLLALGWRFLHAAFRRALYSEEWNIGIADAPIEDFLVPGAPPPIRWLPEDKGGFVADPFWLREADGEGGLTIVAERFDRRAGRGHIVALETSPASARGTPLSWRTIIAAPTHLSYPYALRHDGATYCVPESGAAREVALYKMTAYPYRWERCATLITDFAALDATVFHHDGRWWLFCSEARHIQNNTLFAWHAPDIFGPWTPHAGNPLKVDIRSSRPGGTPFVYGGALYRPAQDCSRTYGGAVAINRVRRLTPTDFAEEPVVTVSPDVNGPYREGLHTLSAYGRCTLVDGKRARFDPLAAWPALRAAGVLVLASVRSRLVRLVRLARRQKGQRRAL